MGIIETSKKYTLLISILPVVMMYKFPGLDVGFSTVMIVLGMIYASLIVLKRKDKIPFRLLFIFYVYIIYVMTKSTGQNIFLCIAIIIHITAISTGILNESYLRKIIENIAVIAAFCVTFQQIIHFFLGIHVPFAIGDFFIDSLKIQYSKLLATGAGGENMYRPCAFFLEPAHYANYCIIGLGSCLFSNNLDLRKASIITFGIFMCTSGMGFVSSLAMWGWWKFSNQNFTSWINIANKLVLILIFLIIAVVILDNISVFHNTISRMTADPDTDYNAINGRLFYWDSYFGDLNYSDLIFGFGLENLPEVYFTGFMKQLYCYGIVGFSLLFSFLILLLFKSDHFGKACTAIYTGLLFFADSTGFISVIFYLGALITFYINKENHLCCEKIKKNI